MLRCTITASDILERAVRLEEEVQNWAEMGERLANDDRWAEVTTLAALSSMMSATLLFNNMYLVYSKTYDDLRVVVRILARRQEHEALCKDVMSHLTTVKNLIVGAELGQQSMGIAVRQEDFNNSLKTKFWDLLCPGIDHTTEEQS